MLRLAVLKEFEHIAPALDPTVRCGRATSAQAEERLKRRHRLLSTVVSEHEFVEVGLELGPAYTVMGANQPVLEIADDSVGERHDGARALTERRSQWLLERDVAIPSRLQAGERAEAVGVDRRTAGHVRLDDAAQGDRREIRQHNEADSPRTIIPLFDGHQNGDRATVFQLTASGDAGLRPANPGVIELDVAMERLAGRIHHRSAQLVEHHPRGLIAPQPELMLDPERRDTALVSGHQVRRPEPLRERRLRVMQNRPSGQRDLMPALGALPPPRRDRVRPLMTAPGTDKAVRPAARRQVLLAGLLGCELTSELVQILGKRRARHAPTLQIVAG